MLVGGLYVVVLIALAVMFGLDRAIAVGFFGPVVLVVLCWLVHELIGEWGLARELHRAARPHPSRSRVHAGRPQRRTWRAVRDHPAGAVGRVAVPGSARPPPTRRPTAVDDGRSDRVGRSGLVSGSVPGLVRRRLRAEGWARSLVPVVVVVAAVVGWSADAVAGVWASGGARFSLLTVAAVGTAVSAGAGLWHRRRANTARVDAIQAARTARVRIRMALSDTVDPLAHLLGRLATAEGAVKTQLRGQAIALAVAAVAGQAQQQQRARVCFYLLEHHPLQLSLDRFAGRAGAPTTTFTPDTSGGAGAMGIARGASWLYIPDTTVQPPPCWLDDERGYRSLLLGPVTTPKGPIGILSIDAPDPHALDQIDLALIRLLATLLATALSI